MDVNVITSLVSSVGFPIACCVFCGYYISTTLKDITKTIENNTLAIQKLITELSHDKE